VLASIKTVLIAHKELKDASKMLTSAGTNYDADQTTPEEIEPIISWKRRLRR
jgi:hypothetical protein